MLYFVFIERKNYSCPGNFLEMISEIWALFVFRHLYYHQTFVDYVFNQYTHSVIYQYARRDFNFWNNSRFCIIFLWIFIHNWLQFMSEELYLDQISKDCIYDWWTHFGMFKSHMWLHVMGLISIWLRFKGISTHN